MCGLCVWPPLIGHSCRGRAQHSPCSPPEGTKPLQARWGAVAGKDKCTLGMQPQLKPLINFVA